MNVTAAGSVPVDEVRAELEQNTPMLAYCRRNYWEPLESPTQVVELTVEHHVVVDLGWVESVASGPFLECEEFRLGHWRLRSIDTGVVTLGLTWPAQSSDPNRSEDAR